MKVSRQSPMMETIELVGTPLLTHGPYDHCSCQCIPHVDGEVLTGLVPRLVDVFKSGVGLGTKVCDGSCTLSKRLGETALSMPRF